jgi:hypothetical protein
LIHEERIGRDFGSRKNKKMKQPGINYDDVQEDDEESVDDKVIKDDEVDEAYEVDNDDETDEDDNDGNTND